MITLDTLQFSLTEWNWCTIICLTLTDRRKMFFFNVVL